jgi:hypothetical protein
MKDGGVIMYASRNLKKHEEKVIHSLHGYLKSRVGVMLMKDGGVIVYASRKLKKHEEIYATHYLELVVVMLALKLWRHYLVG